MGTGPVIDRYVFVTHFVIASLVQGLALNSFTAQANGRLCQDIENTRSLGLSD